MNRQPKTWAEFKTMVDEYLASQGKDDSIKLEYLHYAGHSDQLANFYIGDQVDYDGLQVWQPR